VTDLIRIYIDQAFLDYFATMMERTSSDPTFIPEFDINNDGVIDIVDLSWFTSQFGQWVTLGTPTWPYILVAGVGALAVGFVLSKMF